MVLGLMMVFCALGGSVAGAYETLVEPWQDATRYESSRLPMRAQTFPQNVRTLNGDWAFHFSPEPAHRPQDFFKPDFDVSTWARIPVPACWELQGYGVPLYVNYTYPFQAVPPRVMDEPPAAFTTYHQRNPVGSYRRTFTVPESWQGDRIVLSIGGASSAYYVWVNGTQVGYAEDSRLPSEFDITAAVHSGENMIAIEVYKYSDGSYLEDDDFWRLAGIFREVLIYAVPPVAFWDLYVRSELRADYSEAHLFGTIRLWVDAGQIGSQVCIAAALKDPHGVDVLLPTFTCVKKLEQAGFVEIALPEQCIDKPMLWDAEQPQLYTLTWRLIQDGHTRDCRTQQLGLREARLIDGEFAVNGRKIKMKGVNRHEMDPERGYVQTRAVIERDLRLIKQGNFNFVRTAHYPCDRVFYAVCDQLGLYVMDEANIESHGLSYHKKVLPGDLPEWTAPTCIRGQRMVIRDRGYACVVAWSLGNEAGYGSNFMKLREVMRAEDPEKRIIQYADMNIAADVDSQTYPTPEWLCQHLQNKAQRKGERNEIARIEQHGPYPSGKPFLMNEYAHAMGNSLGNFDEYWMLIERNPRLLGGFIWDWVDQGLWKVLPDGRKMLAYGGDFGDQPNNGNFCINGLVSPVREPHPQYWQAKRIQQPIGVFPGEHPTCFVITNKHQTLSLAAYDIGWRTEVEGAICEQGTVHLATRAGACSRVTVPLAPAPPGQLKTITWRFQLRQDTPWAPAGFCVAQEQVIVQDGVLQAPALPAAGTCEERADEITLCTAPATYVISKKTGFLVRWSVAGQRVLDAPMQLNFWRVPTDNDEGMKMPEQAAVWRQAVAQARVETCTVDVAQARVCMVLRLAAGQSRAILQYRTLQDGVLQVNTRIEFVNCAEQKPLPNVPKIGYQLVLAGAYSDIHWFGRGPMENYWDRKNAADISIHQLSVEDFITPYVRPQENSTRCDVRWLACMRAGGRARLCVWAEGTPLMVSAWPYTQADLSAARHDCALPRREILTVNLDHVQMGVGGDNSWGLPVHAAYRIPAKGAYTWQMSLRYSAP